MPSGGPGGGRLARVLVLGAAAVYGASNSLFNVEGGHRAIVFNRITGVKDEVGKNRCFEQVIAAAGERQLKTHSSPLELCIVSSPSVERCPAKPVV